MLGALVPIAVNSFKKRRKGREWEKRRGGRGKGHKEGRRKEGREGGERKTERPSKRITNVQGLLLAGSTWNRDYQCGWAN